MTITQKWRILLAWLHRNFSLANACHVRTIKISDKLCGSTDRDKKGFHIKIRQQQCFTLRVDTLIHEWAHALTWFGAETHNEDHSAEWGIQYAKIYRTFLEWNWGREPDEEKE